MPFFGGPKSNQYGTINLAATNVATATITAVDVSKAELVHLGQSYNVATSLDNALVRLTLTDSTTVTATRSANATGTAIVSFRVTESY